ncbi:MAG: oligosaccharide flippase family protein [Deinococcus sp.]|uniref:oligosaccharide flippase family protein n=1 Tax=Deinococcus sp. TaxID=47478 RepID=UPI0026DB1D4E|nr:oligosaccharide flippase family protein [Deinococcus sp.]MDO4244611.1 oligosaccharide flippase family protein [Deinococcus sp.]
MTVLKSTVWLMSGYVIRQAAQVVTFILLARLIGAEGFGMYAAALAAATMLSPFLDLGGYSLVVREIENGEDVPVAVGRALTMSFSVAVPVLAIFIVFKLLLLGAVPWTLALCVFFAEAIANRVISISSGVHVAKGLVKRNALIESLTGITRLILVCFLSVMHGDVVTWGVIYFVQAAVVAVLILLWISRSWGRIMFRLPKPYRPRLIEGVHFAFGNAALTSTMEVDKLLITRLVGLPEAGIYAAAQRIVILTNAFLFSFLTSVYPKFFEFGKHGHIHSKRFALKLLPVTLLYGAMVFVALYFFAPYLPRIIGSDFENSVVSLQFLSFLAVINAVHYPLADALTGAGLQSKRTLLYLLALIVSVMVNLIFIPQYGWFVAVYANLLSQIMLSICLALYTDRRAFSSEYPGGQ